MRIDQSNHLYAVQNQDGRFYVRGLGRYARSAAQLVFTCDLKAAKTYRKLGTARAVATCCNRIGAKTQICPVRLTPEAAID